MELYLTKWSRFQAPRQSAPRNLERANTEIKRNHRPVFLDHTLILSRSFQLRVCLAYTELSESVEPARLEIKVLCWRRSPKLIKFSRRGNAFPFRPNSNFTGVSFFTRLREKNNSKDLQAFLFPATKITHIFSVSAAESDVQILSWLYWLFLTSQLTGGEKCCQVLVYIRYTFLFLKTFKNIYTSTIFCIWACDA